MWDSAPSCPPALVSPRFTRGDNQARRCWPETCPCHTGSLSEAVSLPCWAECPSERPSPPSNLTAWKMPQPCGTLTSWQLDCIISPPARMEVGMIRTALHWLCGPGNPAARLRQALAYPGRSLLHSLTQSLESSEASSSQPGRVHLPGDGWGSQPPPRGE